MLGDRQGRWRRQVEHLPGSKPLRGTLRQIMLTVRTDFRMMVDDLVGSIRLLQGRALVSRLTAGLASRLSAPPLLLVSGVRFRWAVARRRFAAVPAVQRKTALKCLDLLCQSGNRIRLPSVFTQKVRIAFPQRGHQSNQLDLREIFEPGGIWGCKNHDLIEP